MTSPTYHQHTLRYSSPLDLWRPCPLISGTWHQCSSNQKTWLCSRNLHLWGWMQSYFRWWVHLDLIVTWVLVEETKNFVSIGAIDKPVDVTERVSVLRASFVKVGVVNTHSPLFIGFLDHHNIWQPCWIRDFSNEASTDQFLRFFLHSYVLLVLLHRKQKFCGKWN